MRILKKNKTERFGWSLHVKFEGATKFERVGGCFVSRYEAEIFRTKKYPNAKNTRVQGLRINVEPLAGRETPGAK